MFGKFLLELSNIKVTDTKFKTNNYMKSLVASFYEETLKYIDHVKQH